jgi:outer membrane protein
VRAELAAQVAEAFGAVLVAEEQRRLYAALAATTGELARQADLRFRAGEAPRTDASQAGSRHAEARARLAAAEGQVRVARARLSHLVGHDPGELAPLPPPPDVPATLEAAVADAQAASPRLAEAAAAVDAAVAAESGARADRRPTIGAVAEASAVRDQFFPDYRADSLSVALRAQWRLFDGGRARGRLAEASAAVRGARAQLEAARHDVIEAVTTAYAAFESNTLVEQAAAEQRAAALEAVRNVRAEVKVGQNPQIDHLDAEREATAAGVLLLKAQADRLAAACRLKALTGGY